MGLAKLTSYSDSSWTDGSFYGWAGLSSGRTKSMSLTGLTGFSISFTSCKTAISYGLTGVACFFGCFTGVLEKIDPVAPNISG